MITLQTTDVYRQLNPFSHPQIGELSNRNRWLVVKPDRLLPCTSTKLRVAAVQSDFETASYMGITLVPQQADLVAVLETDSERVGLGGSVVLRADKSYDPDHVQVCLQSAISADVFPMKIKSCACQTKLYWF